jgi:hypothetical protein
MPSQGLHLLRFMAVLPTPDSHAHLAQLKPLPNGEQDTLIYRSISRSVLCESSPPTSGARTSWVRGDFQCTARNHHSQQLSASAIS